MRIVSTFILALFSLHTYAQWSQVGGLPDSMNAKFVLVEADNLMAISEDQAWYSTDGGDSWQLVGPGLEAPISATKYGGEFWISSSDSLWRTEDQSLPIFFYEVPNLSPGVLKAFGKKMIVSSIDEPPLTLVELQDNGQLTVQRPLGTTGLSFISSVATSEESIGLTDGLGRVYISGDEGDSWDNISSNLFQLGVNTTPDSSFLRNISGQWVITNGQLGPLLTYDEVGDSWTPISLPRDMQGKSVTLLEEKDSTIYLGLQGGELYTSLDFQNWEEITDNLPGAHILSLDISDSLLYVGLEGEGVWRQASRTAVDTSIATSFLSTLRMEVQELNVYPNPANQHIQIYLSEEKTLEVSSTVTVTNSLGQVLFADEFPSSQPIAFSISRLPAGVYWVKVKTKDMLFVGPFVKD